MNKKILTLTIMSLFFIPVVAGADSGEGKCSVRKDREAIRAEVKDHRAKQRQENQNFRKKARDMDPKDRYEAAVNHTNTQFRENQNFRENIYHKTLDILEERYECYVDNLTSKE